MTTKAKTPTAKPATKRATAKPAELLFAVSKTGGKESAVSYTNIAAINPPSSTELGAASAALQDARLALIAHNVPELVSEAKNESKKGAFAKALNEYFGAKVANAERTAARLILTTDAKAVCAAWNAHVEGKKRFSDVISLQAVAKVIKGPAEKKAPTLKEKLQAWAVAHKAEFDSLPETLADILIDAGIETEDVTE